MEEDSEAELAAVEAVYGSDCRVIERFPPRIHLHTRPRTADNISQQFVEATLEVCADVEYPVVPPQVRILDSKGLDGVRQQHLIEAIESKGKDLSSFPMLVSLCEEAIEILSSMNHPDGNCPLCLVPLHFEGGDDPHTPFMKLMSCFHCFHSGCILRWLEPNHVSTDELIDGRGLSKLTGQADRKNVEHGGFCPVCRKVFHVEDIEHLRKLLKPSSPQMDGDEVEVGVDEDILNSETERLLIEKFEAALKVQQGHDGLIKPKKEVTLQPGMFLPKQEVSKPLAAETSGKLVKLRTIDNKIFELEERFALMSPSISLWMGNPGDEISLQKIDGDTLTIVIDYLKHGAEDGWDLMEFNTKILRKLAIAAKDLRLMKLYALCMSTGSYKETYYAL